ncbi:MAG: hypothetical protein KAH86_02875 [Methanosarcinales archaeon]|nr:hypothetical protein [Methanosarcinales archaeon]
MTAAESYNNDINSIKAPFATLAFIMVFLQLPLGIALYTHTTYDKHAIIRKLHRSVGYILLFVFVFTTALCVANYNIDTYTVQISAHIVAGIVGAIAFPLKIGIVRNYGGYAQKSMIYGSALFIVFFMLYVTTRI